MPRTKTTKPREFYQEIGRKGGRAGTGHKFAHGKVDPSEAGKMGLKKRHSDAPTE